jgi:hypothetical protein
MMKKENILPQPDYTICPKHYCFHWLEKGDYIAKGLHNNLKVSSNHFEKVIEGGCGNSFGLCLRDEQLKVIKIANDDPWIRDRYEPCEPALNAAGLPHNYFLASKLQEKGTKTDFESKSIDLKEIR